MSKVLVTDTYLTNIANAIRSKNGSSNTYTPAQMSTAIEQISTIPFTFGDIPDYVRNEALGVAQKVRAVQTANTVTSIIWSDAHHCASQSSSSWQTQTNISTLHAAMGAAVIAALCPLDFCSYCGDYTLGNGDTTLALFEEQCVEMNKYMDLSFGGVPSLYCVGNHDTGEYYLRDNPSGALYGADTIYRLIGGRNADGVTVMGSTTYGYCYRDLTTKKTRVICLNTVEGETTGGYTGGQCSDTQLLWFAQKLYEIGTNADWSIIVVSHYPLDYGGTYKAGNIVYEYVNGGSVTYNGTTVNFSGHNLAKFAAQYHGHTHCLKVDKLHKIANNAGIEFDAYRVATPSGTFYRNNDYAGTAIYGIDFGETQTYTKTANSGKDTAFVVNVYDPNSQVIHSFCYGAGYDRVISVGATVYRSIVLTLVHTASSNMATSIEDGLSYTTTISADLNYDIDTVTIKMGGVDITSTVYNSTTGVISISSVNGDVVISATAAVHVNYHNLVPTAINSSGAIAPYENNKSLSSSGEAATYNGYTLTGFIALENNNVKHIYRVGGTGITWAAANEYDRVAWYDASFALLKAVIPAKRFDSGIYYPSTITSDDESAVAFKVVKSDGTTVVSNVPASAAYFRIGATGLGENLIVTLDEEIKPGTNLINQFGYEDGKRLSISTGNTTDKARATTTGFIRLADFVKNQTVSFWITGTQFIHKSSPWDDNAYIFYNTSKALTVGNYLSGTNTHGNITVTCSSINDNNMTITISGLTPAFLSSGYCYLRMCGTGSGSNTDIRDVSG